MSFVQDLRELLERSEDLPTLPDVVFELHAAFDREDVGQHELAAIIQKDPALMARLLRAANSPAFRRGDRIADVHAAIQLMGMKNVRATWIVLGVVKTFEGQGSGLDHRAFWNHAAAVGLAAQRIWRYAKIREHSEDQLYVAGLLHDVGVLVLDQFFPERAAELEQVSGLSGDPKPECERLVLGMDHGVVGGLLLGSWSLPEVVVETVSHHHDPSNAPAGFEAASQAVYAAEHVCAALDLAPVHEVSGELNGDAPLIPPEAIERAREDVEEAAADGDGLSIV